MYFVNWILCEHNTLFIARKGSSHSYGGWIKSAGWASFHSQVRVCMWLSLKWQNTLHSADGLLAHGSSENYLRAIEVEEYESAFGCTMSMESMHINNMCFSDRKPICAFFSSGVVIQKTVQPVNVMLCCSTFGPHAFNAVSFVWEFIAPQA